MKKSIFILSLLAVAFQSQSQTPDWVKFSAPSNYANYDTREVSAAVDTLGNIYEAASITDTVNNLEKVMLVKYNSAGTQQWMKFYDATGTSNGSRIVTLLVDKVGNSYLCGYGKHNSTSTKDIMIVKFDNTGNQVWVQYWDNGSNDNDYTTCATFDAAGNIVVGGYFVGNTGNDICIIKWDITGTKLWDYRYNNSPVNGEDRALAISHDSLNNVFITGSSYGTVSRDMLTIKVNSAGVNQWVKRVAHGTTGDDNYGYDIVADATGNSYVTGAVTNWITIKYDPSGAVLWTNNYTSNALDRYSIKRVLLDRYHRLTTVGDAFVSSANQTDLVINQINSLNGSNMGSEEFNYGGIDNFGDAVLDTSGTVYVAGQFEGPQGRDMSASIVHPDGNTVFGTTYSNVLKAVGTDIPYKAVVDKNRNFYLAGLSETRGNESNDAVDVTLLKYGALVTGIAENSKDNIFMNLYPNPSKGLLNLNVNNVELIGSLITVTNVMGEKISEEKIKTLNQTINLEQSTKGIYFVTIKTQKSSITKKLIVE